MSLKKHQLKSKPICKVTFRLPKGLANEASRVALAGDFNNWDIESSEMKKLKNGDFTSVIDLNKGESYEFRYFADGKEWINDNEADRYVQNQYGAENCVVETI